MAEKISARKWLEDPASNEFKKLCELAGTEPTRRQVRKFNLKKGKAYRFSQEQRGKNEN